MATLRVLDLTDNIVTVDSQDRLQEASFGITGAAATTQGGFPGPHPAAGDRTRGLPPPDGVNFGEGDAFATNDADALLLVVGCQDKKPEPAAPAAGADQRIGRGEPRVAGYVDGPAAAHPWPTPLTGTLAGKPFRPERIAFDGIGLGTIVTFATADDHDSTLHSRSGRGETRRQRVDVRQQARRPTDHACITRRRPSTKTLAPDYALTLKINKQDATIH